MLKEFKKIRQEESFRRRLFTDDCFDLYVWYSAANGEPFGFQLVYDKERNPHALTWEVKKGFLHSRIDDGEPMAGRPKQSPILVANGFFDKKRIAHRFKLAARHLEREISEFVFAKILEF